MNGITHIVSIIYNDESLWEEYNLEMKSIVERIVSTRKRLVQELELRKVPGDWKHIQKQTGMFSFTGQTPEQSQQVIEKWDIQIQLTGRVSIVGVNKTNIEKLADAMADVVKNY